MEDNKVLVLAKQTEMRRMFLSLSETFMAYHIYIKCDPSRLLCRFFIFSMLSLYGRIFSRDVWEYFQTSVKNVERQTLRIRASSDQCLHYSLISSPVLLMRETTIQRKEKCAILQIWLILVNNAGEICAWHTALVQQTYICTYT